MAGAAVFLRLKRRAYRRIAPAAVVLRRSGRARHVMRARRRDRAQVAGHPGGADAGAGIALEVRHGVFHQHRAMWRDAGLHQQPAQHAAVRLGPQVAMHPHLLDCHHALEAMPYARYLQHRPRVVLRRIGDQDLAPRQAPQVRGQPAPHPHHVGQRREFMRGTQEVSRVHAMVPDHAEQRGAVALPVVHAHAAGGGLVAAEHARHVVGHQPVDGREDRVRGVVQGVVEIEQPDRIARGIARGAAAEASADTARRRKT
ncbi:hypothetical protein D3C72_1428170 [compost metagenome]